MRNILFKFKATFSHVNKRFPVQSENSTEWKSALRICLRGNLYGNKSIKMAQTVKSS